MKNNEKLIIAIIFVFCLGIGAGYELAVVQFIADYEKIPFNQGFLMGINVTAEELSKQCPDLDTNKLDPKFLEFMRATYKAHGDNAIMDWLQGGG